MILDSLPGAGRKGSQHVEAGVITPLVIVETLRLGEPIPGLSPGMAHQSTWLPLRSHRGFHVAMKTIAVLLCSLAICAQAEESAPTSLPARHHLVNLLVVRPALLQEIPYATTYNFTGKQLYPFPAVFVHKDLAAPLRKIQQELARRGLGLKIYDGYRPLSVQQKMWDLIRDERYVSNPSKNRGRHTRGTAVDVTLVDRLGNQLKMPTTFDDFTEKAHRTSNQWTAEERANSRKLEAVMSKHGFIPYPYEWWHFDFRNWEKYPPLDISFDQLARGVPTTVVPVD
jgi:D-alanyl-D-alanine dipeptidase